MNALEKRTKTLAKSYEINDEDMEVTIQRGHTHYWVKCKILHPEKYDVFSFFQESEFSTMIPLDDCVRLQKKIY